MFLIIDHAIEREADAINADLLSEVSMLEEDIREGQAGLVTLKNTLDTVSLEVVTAEGRADRIRREIEEINALLAALDEDGASKESLIDSLKRELSQLESEVERLGATAEKNAGKSARDYIGDGNRQVVTGIKLSGKRIAILVDVSASMIDKELIKVQTLRFRDSEIKKQTPKWQRNIATISWITANLPPSSLYQVIFFNTEATYGIPEKGNVWLEVSNRKELDIVAARINDLSPNGGTSLETAFSVLNKLIPKPDNIFLITDGLPTQGSKKPRDGLISSREREALFKEARKLLPQGVPVNTILFPMEGDPMAPYFFWDLAIETGGSMISPSENWP